eukprot:COSAG01_NODE_3962_length_5492_cov_71.874281_1_plen_354_part_00
MPLGAAPEPERQPAVQQYHTRAGGGAAEPFPAAGTPVFSGRHRSAPGVAAADSGSGGGSSRSQVVAEAAVRQGRRRGWRGGALAAGVAWQYLEGLRAACALSSLGSFVGLLNFFRSDVRHGRVIRVRVWQCLLINGVIFLGSVVWLQVLVLPCVTTMLKYAGTDQLLSTAPFETMYNVTWVYPMYVTTLCLVSPRLFKDVAHSAYQFSLEPPRQPVHEARSQRPGASREPEVPPTPVASWPRTPRASPGAGTGAGTGGARARGGSGGGGAGAAGAGGSGSSSSSSSSLDLWDALDGVVRFGSDSVHYLAIIAVFYLQTFTLVGPPPEGSLLYVPSLLTAGVLGCERGGGESLN